MFGTYSFEKVINGNSNKMEKITAFLSRMDLGVDVDVELFVVAYQGREIAACGGLAGNTLKSIAVDESHQGHGLSTTLLTELVTHAYDLADTTFLFTPNQRTISCFMRLVFIILPQ